MADESLEDIRRLTGILCREDKSKEVKYEDVWSSRRVAASALKEGKEVKYEAIWSSRRTAASALKKIAETTLEDIKAANITKQLVKELGNKDRVVREIVVNLLDILNWKPTNDKERLYYLIAKEKWNDLADIGKPAIKYLISYANDYDIAFSQKMVDTLIAIGDAKAINKGIDNIIKSFSLHRRYPDRQNESIEECIEKEAKVLASFGKPAVPKLIELVKHDKQFVAPATWALCKIGDREAAEPVLNWVLTLGFGGYVSTSAPVLRISDLRKTIPTSQLSELFGDYYSLILDVFGYEQIVQKFDLDPSTLQRLDSPKFNVSKCEQAVQKLCNIKTPVSSNILHKLSKANRIILMSYHDPSAGYVTRYIDFSSYSRKVKGELKIRGNPRYDPSVYLNVDAWKL